MYKRMICLLIGLLLLFSNGCLAQQSKPSNGHSDNHTETVQQLCMINKATGMLKATDDPNTISAIQKLLEDAPKEEIPYEALFGGIWAIEWRQDGKTVRSVVFVGTNMLVDGKTQYRLDFDPNDQLQIHYDNMEETETAYSNSER